MSNNLPEQLTSFIGRESEIVEVHRLLAHERLVTLTGIGGTGKTRLALEVARGLLERYPDGVWLVELAAVSDREAVPQAVASVLGVREASDRSLLATLADYLRTRKLLLILDNCEHLVATCSFLAHALLRTAASVHILATSRQALGLEGEYVRNVPPLSLPEPARPASVDETASCEAVQLFVERARLRRSDFVLTHTNASSVAYLCRQLDGLPLAIELAAARVRVLSVEQIVERLDERFQLFTAPGTVFEPRHRTLIALIDWSHELLSVEEQALLRRLSVFVGGYTLEALRAVCNPQVEEWQTIELISQLVDKSLVIVEEHDGQARYRLLETIRQYAWEKLQSSGEAVELRERHLQYYLGLVEQSEDELLGDKQGMWLARLEREYGNLRAALEWSRVGGVEGHPNLGLRLAGALVWFWYFRGYLTEGRSELEAAIENAQLALRADAAMAAKGAGRDLDAGGPPIYKTTVPWATALTAVGTLAFLQGDYSIARSRLEESLSIWRELDDKRGTAFALAFLGRVAMRQGDLQCGAYGEESVSLFRQIGEKWGLALSLDFLGEVARESGDEARAGVLHDESMALYQQLGHRWGVALELSSLGRVDLQKEDYAAARARLEEAVDIQREVGDKWMLAWTLRSLAAVVWSEGDYSRARELLSESLSVFQGLDDKEGVALTLDEILRMDRASTGQREKPGIEPSIHAKPDAEQLTHREAEVLRLVADGLTDGQIAEQLCVSIRTVQAHIRAIYRKLGITSRSAATRYTLEHKLN